MTNARWDKPHFGLSAKLVCDTSLSSALYGELFLPICIESAGIRHHDDTGSIGTKIVVYRIAPEAQGDLLPPCDQVNLLLAKRLAPADDHTG